jgi:hypothetical protein
MLAIVARDGKEEKGRKKGNDDSRKSEDVYGFVPVNFSHSFPLPFE